MSIDWEKCNTFVIDANILHHLFSDSEDKRISNEDGHITCLLSEIFKRDELEYLVDSKGFIVKEYIRVGERKKEHIQCVDDIKVNDIETELFSQFFQQINGRGFLSKKRIDCKSDLMKKIRKAGVPLRLENEENQDPDALLVYLALHKKKPLITNDYRGIIDGSGLGERREELANITYPKNFIFSSREAAQEIKGTKDNASA